MGLDRREFVQRTALLAVSRSLPVGGAGPRGGWVNDVHSQLNRTRAEQVWSPGSVEELQDVVVAARRRGRPVCLSGSSHAMGGQQYLTDALPVDVRGLRRIGPLDP